MVSPFWLLWAACGGGCTGGDADECSRGCADCFCPGFWIDGTAVSLPDQEPVDDASLCVSLVDPTPVVDETGGLDYLDRDVPVSTDGSFTFELVATSSIIGLVVITHPCPDASGWAPLGTGISSDLVASLDYGDELTGVTAYALTTSERDAWQEDLDLAQVDADLESDGFLAGVVLDGTDPDQASPVGGATVVAEDHDVDVFYGDDDLSDGRFTTGTDLNGSTDAATLLGFLIPGAPIGTYTASDGQHEYASILAGTTEGVSMFLRVPRMEGR